MCTDGTLHLYGIHNYGAYIIGSLPQLHHSTYPKDLVNFLVPTALSLKAKEFRIQTSKRLIFFIPEYDQEQHC